MDCWRISDLVNEKAATSIFDDNVAVLLLDGPAPKYSWLIRKLERRLDVETTESESFWADNDRAGDAVDPATTPLVVGLSSENCINAAEASL